MTLIEREFVSLVSATGQRNGAGFNTCQGLYHKPKGQTPKVPSSLPITTSTLANTIWAT